MTIYQDILNWAQSRPDFFKDALRRIITSSIISQNDIDELVLLLKKEHGAANVVINAIPIDNTHIPVSASAGTVYPKLSNIKNPINISALHQQANLQFSTSGLNIVYGNNGSGKSSYSRILKKLCWSRHSNIDLKKNVFNLSASPQQVDFTIESGGTTQNFRWIEGMPTHPSLTSIFVYDNQCGDIYINNENPTEYKPIGIDVLERLISVLVQISHAISSEMAGYNIAKPNLPMELVTTVVAQWYANLETQSRLQIDSYIQFDALNSARKLELINLINIQDPQQNILLHNNFRTRVQNYSSSFQNVEQQFSEANIGEIRMLVERYIAVSNAYNLATAELTEHNSIAGLGNNAWRILWEAAKNFANTVGMTDGENFPSGESLEKCVLCQQNLDENARQRMLSFNTFILNDISSELNDLQLAIVDKINLFNSLVCPSLDNLQELRQFIPDFDIKYSGFSEQFQLSKDRVIKYLENKLELIFTFNPFSQHIDSLIPGIDIQISQFNQLHQNRSMFLIELNELSAKEFLFTNKSAILQYFDHYKYRIWLNECLASTNTSIVSRKIGELMENQSVTIQHQEFIRHLNSFNSDLASKVLLSKTRTSQGNTFQKCSLSGISDSIDSILSEGEQRVIALSNFFAESTIDNRQNTLVFDDPVTSLDMDYRESIAIKIIELSRNRQIIVLTHDLSFVRLLIDIHKALNASDCNLIGIEKYNGISGIVTDEIPYLAKNVDERIGTIRRILRDHDSLQLSDAHNREVKLDSARKKFRMLLERSVEEILSNKTYERFSKNVHLKKGNLSSYIITEESDVDFLLQLYGKYSVSEHDGGISTIPQLPTNTVIDQDITDYLAWKIGFKSRLQTFLRV